MKQVLPLFALTVAVGMAASTSQDSFKRERSPETGAAKDALEGKPAPPLKADLWLNTGTESATPTWESLRGKVVLVEFWAHW